MAYQEERLISYLKREMANFLLRHAVMPEGAFFSVARIYLNSSLDEAKVFILIFPENLTGVAFREIKALERKARKYLSMHLKRRKIPKIIFKLDNDQEKEISLEKLLEKVKNE